MRKWNKLLALVLAMVMVFGLTATAFATEDEADDATDTTPTEATEPAEDEDADAPAEGEDAEAPAEGEDADAPAEGEDADAPAEGEDADANDEDEDADANDAAAPTAPAFTDVSDWAADAVAEAVARGLINGVSETEFGAKTPITRAQMAVALYRLAGTPANAEDAENPFPDVADDTYYAAAVIWANANGIFTGRTDGSFDPDASITRQEIAKVLFEYAKAEKVEGDNLTVFKDADAIADWAKDYVNWAVANKVLNGNAGAQNTLTFDPAGNATREQAAVMLVNYINNVLPAEDAEAPADDAEAPAEGEDAEAPAGDAEAPAEGEDADADEAEAPVIAEGEVLSIPTAGISSKVSFYPFEVDGTAMEVLAVLASDGTIRTAFNTCYNCYTSGKGYYVQEGDDLVCQNCGNHFTPDQVEVESSGCSPWAIFAEDKTVTDDAIEISYDFLKSNSSIFANWKTA